MKIGNQKHFNIGFATKKMTAKISDGTTLASYLWILVLVIAMFPMKSVASEELNFSGANNIYRNIIKTKTLLLSERLMQERQVPSHAPSTSQSPSMPINRRSATPSFVPSFVPRRQFPSQSPTTFPSPSPTTSPSVVWVWHTETPTFVPSDTR